MWYNPKLFQCCGTCRHADTLCWCKLIANTVGSSDPMLAAKTENIYQYILSAHCHHLSFRYFHVNWIYLCQSSSICQLAARSEGVTVGGKPSARNQEGPAHCRWHTEDRNTEHTQESSLEKTFLYFLVKKRLIKILMLNCKQIWPNWSKLCTNIKHNRLRKY